MAVLRLSLGLLILLRGEQRASFLKNGGWYCGRSRLASAHGTGTGAVLAGLFLYRCR
jgi:hypothetical protein